MGSSKWGIEISKILEPKKILSSSSLSSVEPPMAEWSSLIFDDFEVNPKKSLFRRGLFSPGSGEVCAKYIALSDSTILEHPYYNYPAVTDPGIEEALCGPAAQKEYDDAGQALYLELCDVTGMAPVRLFHRGLLKDVINLKYYCVNPNGVRNMCLALSENTIVQRLDLTSSFLNDDACYHLEELLAKTYTLKELNLAQCRIGPRGLKILIPSLHNIRLDMLDLSKNQLGEEGVSLLAQKIKHGAKIKRLNLSHNSMGLKAFLALAEAFEYNKDSCTHLDLSWNELFNLRAMKALITSLSDCQYLVELNLSWTGLKGENFIAEILKAKCLQKLDLSYNCLSPRAVIALGEKLSVAKKLKVLNLSNNPLAPKEAYWMLTQMRRKNIKLEQLLMNDIDVTKEFVPELQSILNLKYRANTTITHGRIMNNYYLNDADMRHLLMRRLCYLGKRAPKSQRVDIPAYFLYKRKRSTVLIPRQMMIDMKQMNAKINKEAIEILSTVFPGPKIDKNSRAIDLESVADYVARMWPDAKPLQTPTPSVQTVITPVKDKSTKAKKKSR